MKHFFRTVTGKSVLFVGCLIAAALALASVGLAAWMIGEDFYTQTQDELFDRLSFQEIFDQAREAAADNALFLEQHLGKRSPRTPRVIEGTKNLIFQVLDRGRPVVRTAHDQPAAGWSCRFRLIPDPRGSEPSSPPEPSGVPAYRLQLLRPEEQTDFVLQVALEDGLPHTDYFSLLNGFLNAVYPLRYGIYAITAALGLLALASFIALLAVSGRRKNSDAVHPGILNAVPFDLLCVFELLVFRTIARTLARGPHNSIAVRIAAGLFVTGAFAVFLGMCMSCAARIKQGSFLRNNLIVRVPCAIGRISLRLGRAIGDLYLSLRTVPRSAILLGGLALLVFLDLFLTVATFRSHFFLFWCVKNVLLLLAALYVAASMDRIRRAGAALASGDLSHQAATRGLCLDFKAHAQDLNSIAKGMAIAVEERLKSERMKTELITNVSHDIKTPLTSIINYADLIREANGETPPDHEKIKEYSGVLTRQSEKLRHLIDDLVEASKASTGNLDLSLAPADASLLLTQICGEYAGRLDAAGLTPVVRSCCGENERFILADSRRMWRVFDNIMNNICKYSLPGTRVYLGLEESTGNMVFRFKNTSKDALDMSAEELFERFTRGDKSRHTEGSGLGLSIAKSLVELQGGAMDIAIDGDLFKVTITFPKV